MSERVSPYILFARTQELTEKNFIERIKEISKKWLSMTKEEKKPYYDEYRGIVEATKPLYLNKTQKKLNI